MWYQLASFALGLWLMAAPAVLGYGGVAAKNDQTFGPIIASFACIALWEVTRSWRRVNLLPAAWLLFAPWVLGYVWVATINSLLVGVAVAALSWPRGRMKHRMAGRWKAIWSKPTRGESSLRST